MRSLDIISNSLALIMNPLNSVMGIHMAMCNELIGHLVAVQGLNYAPRNGLAQTGPGPIEPKTHKFRESLKGVRPPQETSGGGDGGESSTTAPKAPLAGGLGRRSSRTNE